jgi:hypothetical protein
VIDHLARQCPSGYDPVRLIGATPVPCGASRETVRRSELAGWAHYGYCGSHSRWYWGLKLYLITTPDGMPAAWCLAGPKIGEREVAADLPAHAARAGVLRPGLILVGGKGFAGREFEDLVTTEFKMSLVRPDRRDEAPRHGSIGWIRQWTESVSDTLKGSSTSNDTAARPRRACTPGSPSGCWPWPSASGTTGPPVRPPSGR